MATNDDDPDQELAENRQVGFSGLTAKGFAETDTETRRWFTFDLTLLANPAANRDDQEQEWIRVFQEFNPRLERFLERRAHDSGEVDDILSHTWEQVYLHVRLGKLESPRVMWTWMSTVALRKLIDFQRSRTRAHREIRIDEDPDHEELRSRERCVLQRLIDVDHAYAEVAHLDRQTFKARWSKLSEKDRRFAYLHAVDGFTHAEIAELLDLPSEEASRQRWHRIKKHMHERS